NAWVCPWRIDEGNYRHGKFFRQTHQAQCLAIAFGPRHAKITMNIFLGIASLLVADNHDRLTHKSCQAANDGMIIGKIPVAMKLFEVGEEMLDIIERVGALRMPG